MAERLLVRVRLLGFCMDRNENGKAFDLPVRKQFLHRYYVCTLYKRDIHVLARALPLKVQSFILLLFVVIIINAFVFYYLLFLLVIESFFIIRYCCYVADTRAACVPKLIFVHKTIT